MKSKPFMMDSLTKSLSCIRIKKWFSNPCLLNERKSETLERKMRENETFKGKQLYLAREREVRRVFCARQLLYLLFCQN